MLSKPEGQHTGAPAPRLVAAGPFRCWETNGTEGAYFGAPLLSFSCVCNKIHFAASAHNRMYRATAGQPASKLLWVTDSIRTHSPLPASAFPSQIVSAPVVITL